MTRVFASSVRCQNVFVDKPAIFLLEVNDSFLKFIEEWWLSVVELRSKFGNKFDAATFSSTGIWSDDATLGERLLDNQDLVWLDGMPLATMMNDIQGTLIKIFASGSVVFQAYDSAGEEFESSLLSVNALVSLELSV